MFKSTPANPYDDVVTKATDETLTSENWEIILNLCDKVQDEGEQGARNVIAAILKRLAHRNPNVQLYSLTLSESLSKNCGKDLHTEIASRAFTQALERLITDRTTHDKVRHRALMLIAMWTEDFESDPDLGMMEECYSSLKAKNYKFEPVDEPPPHDDDEARRREEDELQRVLELSKNDKGGRKNWSLVPESSNGAGGSGSKSSVAHPPPEPAASSSSVPLASQQPSHSNGHAPPPQAHAAQAVQYSPAPGAATAESSPESPPAQEPSSPTSTTAYAVTRVRALHTFEPTEPNELAFERGDIIKVVNREYKDWWRGQLKGRAGIFPVNYVEPLPEPTPAELAAEAQQEAAIFAQAANVDRLLTMLRELDPAKDNLADNEEIQELYRSCMSLRPKIVKLIDKYSQKRSDLMSMNESFVRARTIFDRMMEESLARPSEFYEQQRIPYPQQYPRADLRAQGQQALGYGQFADQPQPYGWNPNPYDQAGYAPFPTPATAFSQPRQSGPVPDPRINIGRNPSYNASQPQPQPQGQPRPQQAQPQTAYVQPYPPQDNSKPPYYAQAQPRQTEPPSQPAHAQAPSQPQLQAQSQLHHAQPHLPIQAQPQTQVAAQQQPQPQPQPQPQTESQEPLAQADPHPQVQPQPQQQAQQAMTGPPFVFDPTATYSDQNVQAWAQYYAQGGEDPTGSVYFISVPGITDGHPALAPVQTQLQGQQQPGEGQQPQQGGGGVAAVAAAAAAAAVARGVATSLNNDSDNSNRNSQEGSSLTHQNSSTSSLPNPYGSTGGGLEYDETSGPASAGHVQATAGAPWQRLQGQFAQMRVGEPSVGA